MKMPPRTAVVSNWMLGNPNEKEGLWYQVTPSSDLVEESNELTILPTVVEECLTGNVPIMIANTGLKIMWIAQNKHGQISTTAC